MPTYYANVMGADELAKALSRVPRNTEQVLSKALYEEGQMAFAESQQLTPIETGALRGSGVLHQPNIQPDKVSVALTYGGPAAPYALFVHEILSSYHAAPTQAKYLELPVARRSQFLIRNLATRINHMIRQEIYR
jgi:hypothetical protein